MLEKYDEILNVDDVCEILHVDRRLVYKLIQSGAIPAMKVGHMYRIPKEKFISYIIKSTSGGD